MPADSANYPQANNKSAQLECASQLFKSIDIISCLVNSLCADDEKRRISWILDIKIISHNHVTTAPFRRLFRKKIRRRCIREIFINRRIREISSKFRRNRYRKRNHPSVPALGDSWTGCLQSALCFAFSSVAESNRLTLHREEHRMKIIEIIRNARLFFAVVGVFFAADYIAKVYFGYKLSKFEVGFVGAAAAILFYKF